MKISLREGTSGTDEPSRNKSNSFKLSSNQDTGEYNLANRKKFSCYISPAKVKILIKNDENPGSAGLKRD